MDLLAGDPRWLPHPVRCMGWLAERLETLTRKLPVTEKISGCLTVVSLLVLVMFTCLLLLHLLGIISPFLLWSGAVYLLYTTVATRDLLHHADRVYEALATDITLARQRVAMIVGRDTGQLDEAAIICACVESVAENMSDGIVAPLFWAMAGGLVGTAAGPEWPVIFAVCSAMLYKAVNTMDSMFGYKNEQYLHFGSCPARLDDVLNYLPARLSGWALVLAAFLCGGHVKKSCLVLRRDHACHSSPNAGWTEAAMAGALGLQLGGDSSYFGTLHHKPTLGDADTLPLPRHIRQANRLALVASLLCLLGFSLIVFLIRQVVG